MQESSIAQHSHHPHVRGWDFSSPAWQRGSTAAQQRDMDLSRLAVPVQIRSDLGASPDSPPFPAKRRRPQIYSGRTHSQPIGPEPSSAVLVPLVRRARALFLHSSPAYERQARAPVRPMTPGPPSPPRFSLQNANAVPNGIRWVGLGLGLGEGRGQRGEGRKLIAELMLRNTMARHIAFLKPRRAGLVPSHPFSQPASNRLAPVGRGDGDAPTTSSNACSSAQAPRCR